MAFWVFYLVVGWGWTLIVLWGVWLIVGQMFSYFGDAYTKRERLAQAIVLFVIAFGWQQWGARLNFGITYGTVASADGKNLAVIRSSGWRRFVLLVEHNEYDSTFYLSRLPSHVFWMNSGDEIGVGFPRGPQHIIDMELTSMLYRDESLYAEWTPAQQERYHWDRRKLSPTECEEFDAELWLAKQQGLVWESGE